SIGPQVRDMGGDVHVHAIYNRHDHNQSGGGNNYAQQRKEGAHFVGAQSLQGDPECLARRDPDTGALSLLCDRLGHHGLSLTEDSHTDSSPQAYGILMFSLSGTPSSTVRRATRLLALHAVCPAPPHLHRGQVST